MRWFPRLMAVTSLLLLGGAALGGCKQGVGERCQVSSDCESMMCNIPSGGTPQSGGTCVASGMTAPDLSVGGGPDLAPGVDLQSTDDLSPNDQSLDQSPPSG